MRVSLIPLEVIFELYNEALLRVCLSVVFFLVAYIIYLLLSILKFARLVQINWLEVRHPIFNWCEFRLLNFQLNKNEFEISSNRKPVCEFHPKSLLNDTRNCLQHVGMVSSLSTKIIFIEDAPLKTVSMESWNEQFVC